MKYCSRCGTELVDEAVVCTKCGCAVGTAGQIVAGVSGIGQKFIIGLVGLILGVVGLIYSWVTMTSDVSSKVYYYNSPLSGHEIMIIAIFIISTVVAIVGVFTLLTWKKHKVAIISILIIFILQTILAFVLKPKPIKFKVSKITIQELTKLKEENATKLNKGMESVEKVSSAGANIEATPKQTASDPVRTRRRSNVNNQRKQQANNYVDSAKASGTALDKQIAFYKIAISFNMYNLPAWYGLLQSYHEKKDSDGMQETEKQMRDIFGDEVNSVNTAVAQYGEIMDAYVNESGAYRVEFKTKKTSKDDILRDVFNLTRAVRNSCNCTNISVYASTGPASGLIAHSTAATSVHTLSEFSQQANILWFD